LGTFVNNDVTLFRKIPLCSILYCIGDFDGANYIFLPLNGYQQVGTFVSLVLNVVLEGRKS